MLMCTVDVKISSPLGLLIHDSLRSLMQPAVCTAILSHRHNLIRSLSSLSMFRSQALSLVPKLTILGHLHSAHGRTLNPLHNTIPPHRLSPPQILKLHTPSISVHIQKFKMEITSTPASYIPTVQNHPMILQEHHHRKNAESRAQRRSISLSTKSSITPPTLLVLVAR
jgi:hypothetical protein